MIRIYNSLSGRNQVKLKNENVTGMASTEVKTGKNSWVVNLFVLFCLIFTGLTTNAQNVAVAGADATTTASSPFATLSAAFASINLGTQSGVITITIIGNTSEPVGGAILNGGGWTTMTIQPSGGAARTITGAATAGLPLIDFNGADNVTVNGLNTGGNSLTISNTTASATSGTSTIRFQTDATGNTITNCSVLGSATMAAGTNGGNIWFGSAAVTTGNDNNTVSNCNIGPAGANLPSKGIYFSGSSNTDPGTANSGLVINNNNIFDYFNPAVATAGIDLNSGSVGTVISNNKFYQTATRTQTTGAQHSGIRISNTSGNAYQITGNTIGYASSAGTGLYDFVGVSSSSTFVGINLSVGSTTATSVQGNVIKEISMSGAVSGTSSSAAFRGIYVGSGLTTIGDVSGNTIGDMSATGSIKFNSSSTSAGDVIGIFNFGSANWTTNNNNIGGFNVSNSSTGAANVYGLRCNTSSTVTWTCIGNTVGGNIANSMNSNSTATGTVVNGILNSNPIGTFQGNIIRNLTAAGGTGTATTASVVGICVTSTANHIVRANTIYALNNTNTTAATQVAGIQFTGGTSNVVERNLIYDLSSATNSGTAEVNGIRIAAGTTIYRNNMIRFGSGIPNAIGTGQAQAINGFNESAGTSSNSFLHNSVYLEGTATAGAGSSFVFNSVVTTNARVVRNNIFFNARTNSGATGKHYIVRAGGTAPNPAGLTSNNNIYFANGSGAVFGFYNSLDVANLAAWQAAVGQDAASLETNPLFVSASDLHLQAGSPALNIAASALVTNDFDAETRPGGNASYDIGADERDGVAPVANDIAATAFVVPLTGANLAQGATVTPQASFTNNGTANQTNVTVRYRILNPSAVEVYNNTFVIASLASLASTTVTFPVSGALSPAGVYTIIAKAELAGDAATGNDQITGTINVLAPLSGSYNVGTAGTFTSLTNAGGAFETLNSLGATGNVTFNITSDLSGELGTAALNEVAGGFTVLIQPSGAPRTITGSNTGGLIRLNGADGVTINGSTTGATVAACLVGGNAALRELSIENTNTGTSSAVIALQSGANGAQNNTIKNVNVLGNAPTTTLVGITIGGSSVNSAGTDNDNNRIENCSVKRATYGIYHVGASLANQNTGTIIKQNDVASTGADRIRRIGIFIASDNGAQITQNSVGGMNSSESLDAIAIAVGAQSVLNTTTTAGTTTNAVVSGNKIDSVINDNTYSAVGIAVAGDAGGANTISNNMISGVISDATPGDLVAGIFVVGATGSSTKLYYNTISMTGDRNLLPTPGTGQSPSFGIAINGTDPTVEMKNNIVFNSQTADLTSSAGAKTYAVGILSSTFANLDANYNDYWSTGANDDGFRTGSLSPSAGTNYATVALWSAAISDDNNSIEVMPNFISSTDLHLDNANNNSLGNLGTPIAAVTTDYDCAARSGSTPDMGADEFAGTSCTGAVGGTATGTATFCGPVTDPDIAATGYSLGSGSTYQWMSSSSSSNYPNSGTPVAGQTSPIGLTTGTVSTTTYYWLKVTCPSGTLTAYSNMITITVNPKPTAAVVSGGGAQCGSATLTATGGTGGTMYYQGTTSGGTSTATASSSQTVSVSGTYYFRSYNGLCWGDEGSASVTITANPTGVTATASAANACTGVPFNLFSSANAPVGNSVIMTQNFESGLAPWTAVNTSTGGVTPANVIWAQQATGYVYSTDTFTAPQGTKFAMANADAGGNGTPTLAANTTLTSPGFSTMGYTTLTLTYKHYYRHITAAAAFVEVSTDGTNWTDVQNYGANTGTAAAFASATVDLSAYVGNPNVQVRFRHTGAWYWYWAVDDIAISGLPVNSYSWTSVPAGFTSSSQNPTGVTQSVPRTYTVTVTGAGGCTSQQSVSVGQAGCGGATINLKLFVEGYYQGAGLMRPVGLNQGTSANSTDVENITVELHNAASPYALAHTTTTMLKTNGTAVATFGSSPSGSFYIVIKTRNTVDTWSATPQTVGGTTTYDFSTAASQAFGGNQATLPGSVFGLFSGDMDPAHDGNIDTIDYPVWETDSNNFESGNFHTDLNGDGNVDTIDYPIWENNSNNFVSVVKP